MRKIRLNLVWVLIAAIFATGSCKKDDNSPTNLTEDGVYVVGAGTPLVTLDSKGLMYAGVNEVKQKVRTGMFEVYMTVKAGADGFNIVEKAGAVETTYGPLAVVNKVLTGTNDQPNETIQLGTYAENTNKFTVPADGLYHIVIDKTLGLVTIIPVKHWAVIGAATALGWGGETAFPLKGTFDFASNKVEFEATNLKMDKGEFKFRYDNAWKVEMNIPTTSGDSLKVNTNLGGATLDALTPGGANINFAGASRGFYTINVKWTLADGIKVTMTKTGSIEPTNYTAIKFGIIGNCYFKPDGVAKANWNINWGATSLLNHADSLAHTIVPVVTNTTTYTWTWDHVGIVIPEATADDMVFKIRQDANWSGKSIGYGAVTMAGAAAANFSNKDGNFKCSTVGDYKFILVIDALTENYTFTATKY